MKKKYIIPTIGVVMISVPTPLLSSRLTGDVVNRRQELDGMKMTEETTDESIDFGIRVGDDQWRGDGFEYAKSNDWFDDAW